MLSLTGALVLNKEWKTLRDKMIFSIKISYKCFPSHHF